MSLVRSVSPFGSGKLYSLKDAGNGPGLSAKIFNSDKKQGLACSTESYSNESYDPTYFLHSPSEEAVHSSVSDVLENPFHLPHSSSQQQFSASQNSFSSSFVPPKQCNSNSSSYGSEYLDFEGPDAVDYDEDKMKLKLQELERALFDDTSTINEDVIGHEMSMEDDGGWGYGNGNGLLHDSPKESSSSDSNLSSMSTNKDISAITSSSPKQMLFDCASAIQGGNFGCASAIINELRQRVSIQGDPSERIAAYMVEALAARMATSGKGLYKALKCKEPPSSDRLSAMQVLFEVCPCFRFGFMTANGAILEACRDERQVHIIDFDINQGSQYYTLLQTLSRLPYKPSHLRLTGVDDPESVQRSVGGLQLIGQMLKTLAEDLKIPFTFHAVAAKTADIRPSMLDCRPGEAIIVNFAFQLHHMPDESVSIVNERDQLLRMVKGLNPKLVTLVEQDVNTNTAPFLQRFAEAYSYYGAVFESLDATLPRNGQERMNVERQCLARDIINVVACEGEERIERYEVAGKWRARMMMAGFNPSPISGIVKDEIQKLIKQYSDRYKIKEEASGLHFGWEDKILIAASAWR
ncbi:OLC1v1016534C3 [Oldenlandia corymbosa var. corymbosa]|uniref:OLC1v1016534C3 n=1 Tax=Oldenlandia corymbosa var. corymbosa TaxID=529605 RepID=A0AAV1E5M4_OLDCO|nr:OLC1v1016534C3 [Oldenlandia corymbosa var. corymbosa]